MNKWFTVKAKYSRQLEDGTIKNVTEPYLVGAMTVTDAEARINKELKQIVRGEFNINSVTLTNIHDVFGYDDGEYWWKCKVCYDASDNDSGKVKKITQQMLVAANGPEEASQRIKESLKNLLVEFSIPSVVETKIADIFPAE